jgi:hypothetical protein
MWHAEGVGVGVDQESRRLHYRLSLFINMHVCASLLCANWLKQWRAWMQTMLSFLVIFFCPYMELGHDRFRPQLFFLNYPNIRRYIQRASLNKE